MGRRCRIEVPGGFYHVHTRGNDRQNIYFGNWSGRLFVRELERTSRRHGWRICAYCLMPNHYHLVLQIEERLSKGMEELNGDFAAKSNLRTGRRNHLFGARFTSHLIGTESYLLESIRYVLLNPVRAGLATRPEYWRWSSMRAMLGLEHPPGCLDVGWVLAQFGRTPRTARRAFASFVDAGLSSHVPVPGTG